MNDGRPNTGMVDGVAVVGGPGDIVEVTAGVVEEEQEKVVYRVAYTTSGRVHRVQWVKPAWARVWPPGIRGVIRSAQVGDECGVSWRANEAFFLIKESLPTPEECGAPPAAVQTSPNEFVENA